MHRPLELENAGPGARGRAADRARGRVRIPLVRHAAVLMCAAAALFVVHASLANDPPKKSIKVDFGSTAGYTESDDVAGTAAASTMTAAQKAAVIAKIQKKYDDALGAGKINVSEGTGGDIDIIVNGNKAPGANQGKELGDAGKPGKPGVAHEGEFKDRGFNGDDLVNGVAETAAHEAGHKLGLDHNFKRPPNLMTSGDSVTIAERKADGRDFKGDEIKILQGAPKTTNGCSTEHKDFVTTGDLGIYAGHRLDEFPANPADDWTLDVRAVLQSAPLGTEFGYVSCSGDFMFQGDETNGPSGTPAMISFPYTAGANLAVRLGGVVYALEDAGVGSYYLSNISPYNKIAYQNATVQLNTPSGTAVLALAVDMSAPHTGGFYQPTPSPGLSRFTSFGLALALAGVGALVLVWGGRRRREEIA